MSIKERLQKNSVKDDKGCWIWQRCVSKAGYGQITIGSRKDGSRHLEYAHRLSFALFKHDLTPHLTVDHLCRVRNCINPDHLEEVTHAQNIARGNGKWKQNAAKTHCKRGHEFTLANIRPLKSRYGFARRACRTCEITIHRVRRLRRSMSMEAA